MADLDKQAAARLVAERIGYKVHSDGEGFFFCQYPDGEYSDSVFPSEEEAIAEAFPLFDRTAGALAREEARKWLVVDKGCWINFVAKERRIVWQYTLPGSRMVYGQSDDSLEEAEALAICNAVRGMREDKNG